MNSSSSGRGLEKFLSGKGFYIVLFLCAAVIGASAWMMAAGNETMMEDVLQTNANSNESPRVETVIIPAKPKNDEAERFSLEEAAPAVTDAGLNAPENPAAEEENVPVEAAAPVFGWPLNGTIARGHSGDRLGYDQTMQDWRAHNGVDILAERGASVQAACAGTVESVGHSDMLGMVIVIRHDDGSKTVYANLEDQPGVSVGDHVEAGQAIGAVGRSALGEIAQESHLHFSMEVKGSAVDPLDYLTPAA